MTDERTLDRLIAHLRAQEEGAGARGRQTWLTSCVS